MFKLPFLMNKINIKLNWHKVKLKLISKSDDIRQKINCHEQKNKISDLRSSRSKFSYFLLILIRAGLDILNVMSKLIKW